MNYQSVKAIIDANIRANGQQLITGPVLNSVLTTILDGLGVDPEDFQTSPTDKLQLADRVAGANTSGMGYKILRKNKTFPSQVTDADTIYEIRDNYTLSANFSIPSGCILFFNGGKINGNGRTLTFSRSAIAGNARFENCEFAGTILNGEVKISWFTEGMSSTSDYSVDHSSAFISAMKLTSLKRNAWLDMERIPVCIKQTIVITDAFGNIGIKGGNFYFVSTSDKQALFDYQQVAQYGGNYSPIVDSIFHDVGDHYDTCVIKKTAWSDTMFTYWRDIKVYGFTGYFIVTNSYLQEVTFENISVDGCGFFSTNSDALYSGGYGSGNIINFLNCNCNGGANDTKTTIKAIYDLSDCIEVTIHNAVSQGRIGGTGIYPLYITHHSSTTNRINIVLDGFWVEYVSGNVIGKIKVNDCSAKIEVCRNCPVGLEVISSNLTILMKQAGGAIGSNLFSNVDIDATSNVTMFIDSALYQNFIPRVSFPKFKELVDRGILRIASNSTSPYGNGVNQTSASVRIIPKNEIDAINEYATTKMTALKVTSRPYNHYFTEENGVPILNIEQVGTGTYYEMEFLKNIHKLLGGDISTSVGRSLYTEFIYRVTILVDVDSTNISQVYCKGRGFTNVGGGSYDTMFAVEEGMTAGTSSGWLISGAAEIWATTGLTSGAYLAMRNCKLEIAKFVFARRNVILPDDVYIDSSGNIARMDKRPRVFYLPISAANDIPSVMGNIITNCTALFETPKNMYKYANGSVHGLLTPTGGTTANRPVLATSDRGFVYYDTSLTKAIIWNGSAWVNMDGTALA